jgi:hypothetical protein
MTAESYFPHLQTLDSGEIFSSGAYLSVRASYKDHIKVHKYEYGKKGTSPFASLYSITLLLQVIGVPSSAFCYTGIIPPCGIRCFGAFVIPNPPWSPRLQGDICVPDTFITTGLDDLIGSFHPGLPIRMKVFGIARESRVLEPGHRDKPGLMFRAFC